MSPNIALRTARYQEALYFYADVFGVVNHSTDPNLGDFDTAPLNMFVIDDQELAGVIHELFVHDLWKTRDELVMNGCKNVRWNGRGHDCKIRDPFGVTYNLWEI